MNSIKPQALSISAVAKQFGLRTSAIRYYEEIGLLPRAARQGGQRIYGRDTIQRLAVIAAARRAGLSLRDIKRLYFGFPDSTPVPNRWRGMSEEKIAELEVLKQELSQAQEQLRRFAKCNCETLAECGEKISKRLAKEVPVKFTRTRIAPNI